MSIIEYINENKEWIFSGVGATSIFFFIKIFKLNKSGSVETQKEVQSNKISLNKSNNNAIQIIEKQVNNHHNFKLEENTNPDFANIFPIDIKTEIANAPLYQQNKVASHYIGLRINWKLELFHIHERDENIISVGLVPFNMIYPSIEFDVDIKKHPTFQIAKQRQHYCLKGEIIECSTLKIKIRMESIRELSS